MLTAPSAGRFFVGDYEGLNHAGAAFIPSCVKTKTGDLANRTAVVAAAPEEEDVEKGNREVANDREEVNVIPLSLRQRVESHRQRPHNYLMRSTQALPK